MPKRWTQPRFTMSLLEKPTLRGYGRKKYYIVFPAFLDNSPKTDYNKA